MKNARVYVNNISAGVLTQLDDQTYNFKYDDDHQNNPISLTMPVTQSEYHFTQFPAFFEGLLPEGNMLEALLRKYKIDKKDYFSQLMKVGSDVIGNVTIQEIL